MNIIVKKLILCTLALLHLPHTTRAGFEMSERMERQKEEGLEKARKNLKWKESIIRCLQSNNLSSLEYYLEHQPYSTSDYDSSWKYLNPWYFLKYAITPEALLMLMNSASLLDGCKIDDDVINRIFEWSETTPQLRIKLLQATTLDKLYSSCTTTKTAHILIQNGASLMTLRNNSKSTMLHQLASAPTTLIKSFAIIPHLDVIAKHQENSFFTFFSRITFSYKSTQHKSKERVLATLFCLKKLLPKDMIMHILAQNPEDITNPKMLEALYPHMNERTIAQSCNLLPNAWFKKVLIPEYQKLIVATLTQQRLEYAKKLCDMKNNNEKLARELTTDPEKQLLLDPAHHEEYLKNPIQAQVIEELGFPTKNLN